MRSYWLLNGKIVAAFAAACLLATTSRGEEAVDPQQAQARIRYATLSGQAVVRASAPLTLRVPGRVIELPPGEWTFAAAEIRPAPKRFHVFPKTFQTNEAQEMEEYMEEWRVRGYKPIVETFGLLYKTALGRILDNRVHWVSLARFDSEQEAQALINELKEEPVWAWMRSEKIGAGSAVFYVRDNHGNTLEKLAAPVELASTEPLELQDMSDSFWKERKANRLLAAPLRLEIGMEGAVEVYGKLPVETYLRGVLPAEMPSGWPAEALKAQAVVARSDIYASLAGKYKLEGFDFTALEGCRAYWGVGAHHPNTDAAIEQTAGMALAHEGKFAATVFSSCCGGWTENNENVWSGPPNPVLRGIQDVSPEKRTGVPDSESGWREKIKGNAPAWCSAAKDIFRWQRRYTNKELTEIVNRRMSVGVIRSIRTGARGVSGRLKSVTITGSKGSATVERELAIRQIFGGLPSAMFIIEAAPAGDAPEAFVFYGGGRGHGVGLCQYGARGMAVAGRNYNEIVTHYFKGVRIERMR